MGSSSTGSKYGGTQYKNDGSKYAGYGSDSKKGGSLNASSAPYSTGAYDEGKSTLDKYKNYTGGSLYSKENLKDKKKDEKTEKVETEKKEEETVAPKPFEKSAPTLKKPGELKPPPLPSVNKSVNVAPSSKPPVQAATTTGGSTGNIDFFGFD